jgi:hypothetical protein
MKELLGNDKSIDGRACVWEEDGNMERRTQRHGSEVVKMAKWCQ